jgi:hypothetical protein
MAQSNDEAAVNAAVAALTTAMLQADGAALGRLVADQLSYGHSSGLLETKAQFIDVIASKKTIYKSISLSQPSTVVAGDNAIVRHIFTNTTETAERPAPSASAFCRSGKRRMVPGSCWRGRLSGCRPNIPIARHSRCALPYW